MDHLKPLISDAEVEKYIGVAKQTRANWRVSGCGPRFVRISNRIFYHPDDIAAWVDARRVGSTSQPVAA